MENNIVVEVAYATAQKQKIITVETTQQSSLKSVVKISGITQFFDDIDLDNCDLGIFGKMVASNYELVDGDRIEIYRPLIADPKEIRRQRAEQGLPTKKGGGLLT